MSVLSALNNKFIRRVRNAVESRFWRMRLYLRRKTAAWRSRLFTRKLMIRRLREKEKIKVLFLSHLPAMWKVDSLYLAMLAHPRFEPSIFVIPHGNCATKAERKESLDRIKAFFAQKGYPCEEWINDEGVPKASKLPKEFDILIYPQPWRNVVPPAVDFMRHADHLMICCEYSFHLGTFEWAYNKWYQNMAFVDCYENDAVRELSCRKKYNHGINSVTTGLPIADEFLCSKGVSPWKKQAEGVKKIIWAPHWTIVDGLSDLGSFSNFLSIADELLRYAQASVGRLQFAFKPHPLLKKTLYGHADWGKERTDAYYAAWENGSNTQLEQGDYAALFMESDAMVHDSCSFCCEYMLSGNPVMFIPKNAEAQTSILNEMGLAAFYAQYMGHSVQDIEAFIENQVIRGDDPMKARREEVTSRYLRPPHGLTAAENIINAILGNTPN
ncbi:MAG: hypothetical protein IJB00_00700 [Akkermansia sp.]|nr:hypothetical protein [Akkermansia sp.]